MRGQTLSTLGPPVLICAAIAASGVQVSGGVKQTTWADVAPLRARLESRGITADSFQSYIERVSRENLRRVRDGDLEHLVFYALQSTHFTKLPPIEPALSAKGLADSLDPAEREEFLRASRVPPARIPPRVRSRVAALARALDSPGADARLTYFRSLSRAAFSNARRREDGILQEYARVMRFVYEKEFVAQRAGPAAVAELYRARGLSTDTAVEAGYVVHTGLGILKSLEPGRQIRRVLIVGPGVDLAPRTSLLETSPPESYQPWAVIDALVSLGLSRLTDLTVVGADINPRVVDHLRRSRTVPPSLALVSGIAETPTVEFSKNYRDYFAQLGRSIGDTQPTAKALSGHLSKTVRVRAEPARTLAAESLDIVTERLNGSPFDLIIATNILPYFDDTQLTLAMANIGRMLAPDGVFLHNEARSVLGELTDALGLPFQQSRQVIIASVRGAPPLSDSAWLHRKR